MKIKINGKEIEIEDSTSLIIELEGDLGALSTVCNSNGVDIHTGKIKNISTRGGSIGNIIMGNNNIVHNSGSITENENLNQFDISIMITGNVGQVDTVNGDVNVVKGECKKIKTVNGDITAYHGVGGNIKTVNGNVSVTGDVDGSIDTVNGNITNGNLKR